MKLSDGIINTPLTGECTIDIDIIAKYFNKCYIAKWKDSYRLIADYQGVKITLKPSDAVELIDRLGLVELKSTFFNSASSFVLPEE